jgi:hypothetical protein
MAILKNTSNKILMPNRNLVNGLKFNSANSQWCNVTGFTPGVSGFVPNQPWTLYIACVPLSNTVNNCKPLGTISDGSEFFNLDVKQDGTVQYYWRNGTWGTQPMIANKVTGDIKYIVIQNQTNDIRVWANGKKLVTRTDGFNNIKTATYSNILEIGRQTQFGSGSTYFDGYILDLKLFTTFLSDSDVTKLFKYGGGKLYDVPTANLAAWWKFDENNGLVASDSSGNGYNGALTNYTNAETASSGQPQSGNTAWVNAYGLAPIIV